MLDPELLAVQKVGKPPFHRFLISEILPPCRVWDGERFTDDPKRATIYASLQAAETDLQMIRAGIKGEPSEEDEF